MPDTETPRMSGRVRRLSTYTAGSVIAAGCSEVALVVCYGLLDLAPAVSSTIAWVAGAVPNYWLNRSWTWQRRGARRSSARCCRTSRSSWSPCCWRRS